MYEPAYDVPEVTFEEQRFYFESKSGGSGHEVSLHTAEKGPHAGKTYVQCTCPAGRFAFRGDVMKAGCWAMKAVRDELGMEQP
jgi:hypothetical protein